jgi:putative phosphoribosyl transferase
LPEAVVEVRGIMHAPAMAGGRMIIFAHGGGSDHLSPRNLMLAQMLQDAGFTTLLIDLLTPEERNLDLKLYSFRFNLPLLSKRLIAITDWITQSKNTRPMQIGYFGASTGAAAALYAASARKDAIGAVVSRGGRVDLVDSNTLQSITTPTLFIVGGRDIPVRDWTRASFEKLSLHQSRKMLIQVKGATHLFQEAGKLEEASRYAISWFNQYLASKAQSLDQ